MWLVVCRPSSWLMYSRVSGATVWWWMWPTCSPTAVCWVEPLSIQSHGSAIHKWVMMVVWRPPLVSPVGQGYGVAAEISYCYHNCSVVVKSGAWIYHLFCPVNGFVIDFQNSFAITLSMKFATKSIRLFVKALAKYKRSFVYLSINPSNIV